MGGSARKRINASLNSCGCRNYVTSCDLRIFMDQAAEPVRAQNNSVRLEMDDDLCFTPAVELARRLHARELSARELLDAYLDRIGRVNPALNAIVTLAEEQAARQAAEADSAVVAHHKNSIEKLGLDPYPREGGREALQRASARHARPRARLYAVRDW
jgi:hypothetical protein